MRTRSGRAFGIAALVALAGCQATLGPYELPPNIQTAKVQLKTVPGPWICVEGKRRTLAVDEKGYATIPAGASITLGAWFYRDTGAITSSCAARISFIPIAGEIYQQDFDVEMGRCTAFVYREVSTNPVGLDFVPSMARSGECAVR